MRTLRWIGIVFAVVGLIFAAVGIGLGVSKQSAARGGVEAEGTVVDLASSYTSEGGTTYRPIVEYSDAKGDTHRITGSVGSSPPAYSRGESVKVLYDANSPNVALIDSFTERYLFPLAFGGFGLLFAGIGGGMFAATALRRRTINGLIARGMRIEAEVLSCARDTSVKVNGRSPYRVSAQAKHPATGKLASFQSERMWVDLSEQLEGKTVPVLLDMSKPKVHYIDLSEWVDESEYA